MTEHNTDNRRRHKSWLRPIERVLYSQYDKIISISQMTESNLKQWLQLPKKDDSKFTVISNGVPLNDFKMAHSLEKSEIFNGYKKGDILIGVIGSFTAQKNHRAILDVMEILPYRYKLILVGEGVLAEQTREIAESKKLMDRVAFLGFRKDVAGVMKTLDVVTVPSLWEGFGLVAVEAMASGVPLVVSNVPGLSDVVSNYGLQADPADPNEFASAIRTLENKDEYDKYQKLGIERANAFDINKTIELYLEEFKK